MLGAAPTWNDHYVGVLINGHARYPKDYIEAALDGKAAGTQIVLTATVDGVDLVAVGWKQSRASDQFFICLLYTSPSPRDATLSRMPSSA